MKRFSLLIVLALIPCSGVHSQIIITMADDTPVLESSVIQSYWDSDFKDSTLQIGKVGTGNFYDLAAHCKKYSSRTVGVAIGAFGLPLGEATHAINLGNPVPNWYPYIEYYNLIADGCYLSAVSEPDLYHPPLYVFDPPRTKYIFPMSLGSSWKQENETIYKYQRWANDTSWASLYREYDTVIASGIFRIPEGDFECLTIKRSKFNPDKRIMYELVSKSHVRVFVEINPQDENLPSPRIQTFRVEKYGNLVNVDPLSSPGTSLLLSQNFPNPFNPTTSITYGIPENCFVHLRVYDVNGRIVSELVNGEKQAGTYSVEFDGSVLPSGVYLYRLEAGGQIRTNTMTLVK